MTVTGNIHEKDKEVVVAFWKEAHFGRYSESAIATYVGDTYAYPRLEIL